MAVIKRVLALAAIAAAALMLSACERKITYETTAAQQPATCFDCHSDTDTFLLARKAQWQNSKHASGGTLNENSGSCVGCHTSEGFVARANGEPVPAVVDNPTVIHCFTCHKPHSNSTLDPTLRFGLRWTTNATLENGTTFDLGAGNICVACHHSRRNINTYIAAKPAMTTLSLRWGPHHSNQGDMLLGSNGYEYVGFTYGQTDHRSATDDGCIDCHKKTGIGNFVGGHTFNMEFDTGSEVFANTAACEDCHGAISDFAEVGPGYSVQDSVDVLIGDLETRLETAGLMASGAPVAVKASADSAGAVWNLLMAKEDRSHGVHNAMYTMGLLNSAIQYMSGNLPQPGAQPAPISFAPRKD